ncbi:hypothetical protein Trydic_g16791 [Trypoxylus dichotomus]
MVIVSENYPESSISQEQAEFIRNCILQELDKLNVGGPKPKFSEVRHRAGMLRAACDGAKLKLVRENDLPKPIRALVWMESDQILHRLKMQNQKLPMSSWREVCTKTDPKGQQMVVAIDEGSWKATRSEDERTGGNTGTDGHHRGETIQSSTPEPGGGDGTGSAVDSPRSIATVHTITDLLEPQMVDLLRAPPNEGSDSAGQEC